MLAPYFFGCHGPRQRFGPSALRQKQDHPQSHPDAMLRRGLGNSVPQFCDGEVVFLTNPNGEKHKSCDNEKYASACKKSENQENDNRPPEWKPFRQVYENITQTNWDADTQETGNDQKKQYLDGPRNPFVYPFIGLRFFSAKRMDRFLLHLGHLRPGGPRLRVFFSRHTLGLLARAIQLSAGTVKRTSHEAPTGWLASGSFLALA